MLNSMLTFPNEAVLEILTLRFPSIPQELIAQINAFTDLSLLKMLLRRAATAGALEEFEQIVEAQVRDKLANSNADGEGA